MTHSDHWFCNQCAKAVAALPSAPAGSVLSTKYQQQKFGKHTFGNPTTPRTSIYMDADPAAYEESVKDTIRDGALQIDGKGRRNVFRAVNRPIGLTRTAHGDVVVSGEKIALPDDPARVHGFLYGSGEMTRKWCARCGIQIPW